MIQTAKKPSAELIKAAEVVFLAMTYATSIRPTIEALQKELVDFWKFEPSEKWNRAKFNDLPKIITDWKHIYLADSHDQEMIYAEMDEKIKQSGFNVPAGSCPLLRAENTVIEAEHLLITAAEPITGISLELATRNLKHYKKLVELTLSLCAPFIDSKKVMKELIN